MSHPSLGLPPADATAGYPEAAVRVRTNIDALASKALRLAMDSDRTIGDRHDEAGLRHLLRDAGLLAERVARCLATGEPDGAREYAEWTAPVYRRRFTPMDDVIGLCEGLRDAFPTVLAPAEMEAAGSALDAAITVYRWHRRIAGDARKKNALLQLLYKGA